MTDNVNGDPYEDEFAEGFYRSTNKFFETLLDGKTLQEAENESIAEYNKWIDYWTSSGHPYAPDAIKWLIHDRDGLVIYGDPNASSALCEDVTDKQECKDNGCWWYEDKCSGEHPPDIQDTLEFTVKSYKSKAEIIEFDVDKTLYNIEGHDPFVDMLVIIKNIGQGQSTIWAKIKDSNGNVVWSKDLGIKPDELGGETYRHYTTEAGSFTLEVGHYE